VTKKRTRWRNNPDARRTDKAADLIRLVFSEVYGFHKGAAVRSHVGVGPAMRRYIINQKADWREELAACPSPPTRYVAA
jgi:hypothetical protein